MQVERMTLLPGKLFVTCPKSGSTVDVREKCVECPDFKHITWQGLKPLIACSYEKKPEPEKKGVAGLKRW